MKQVLLGAFAAFLSVAPAFSQSITITAADMPVSGDMLVHSDAAVPANFNINDTGSNINWDFSALTPIAQTIDSYKTAIQAGYVGSNIGLTAYGYKVFDTLSFPGAPVSAKNGYTFFNIKTAPSRFVAEGFGASVGGIPIAAGYSNEDTIFTFPLSYGNMSASMFKLTAGLSGIGSLSQQGTRITKVDAWGTIKTPYFTTPVQVIRVRSEVNEVDTVTISLGTTMTIPVPRHYVEYRWLASGEHYPALFITTTVAGGTETPTAAHYRDVQRNMSIASTKPAISTLQAYPNPASANAITVNVPSNWKQYSLQLYDINGKLLMEVKNTQQMPTASLPSGRYVIIANNGYEMALAQFVK